MSAYVGYRYFFRPEATTPLPTVIVCPDTACAEEVYDIVSQATSVAIIEDLADADQLPLLNPRE